MQNVKGRAYYVFISVEFPRYRSLARSGMRVLDALREHGLGAKCNVRAIRADEAGHHRHRCLGDQRLNTADEMHPAPLPAGSAYGNWNRLSQSHMGITDHQLHIVGPAHHKAPKERQPEGAP